MRTKQRLFCLKPWLLETVVFFVLLWQESLRLSLRTAHQVLPVSAVLQNYYYYHFGDFVNGYLNAFLIDGLTDWLIFQKLETQPPALQVTGWVRSKTRRALLSALISMAVIVLFEVFPSAYTTADLADIMAGAAGAILYFLVRWLVVTQAHSGQPKKLPTPPASDVLRSSK